MRAIIVIPARYASTRFPGKPLALIAGVSLIQRVYERATRTRRAVAVYVATDDARIADHVRSFGGKVLMPEGDFPTGTDRIAAAVRMLNENVAAAVSAADPSDTGGRDGHRYIEADLIVNVQGDEPLIDIGEVDALIDLMQRSAADIGTLACPLRTDDELLARDVVKAVVALDGTALYFSRAPVGSRETALRHIGVYAFRREALERFVALPPSPLERAESLEQLRALQHGFKIVVSQTNQPHHGVDRPEDVARIESELAQAQS